MLKFNQLTGHALAATAAALLGFGIIGSVAAQDEDREAPPAAEQGGQSAVAPPIAETGTAEVPQNQTDQTQPAKLTENQQADDAPPDDLQFDDNVRREDTDPPAIPRDKNLPDERRDGVRNGVRQDDDGRANANVNGVSPSDRTFEPDNNNRNDVRRFDYDDPSQPIPEEQAKTYQGNGCHHCGQRIYHNPCGGCGQSYSYRQWNGNSGNGSPQYQTQNRQSNRPVLGITIRDDEGIRVASVVPNGPAAQAGVQGGDRIVAIDGNDLRDSHSFMNHLRRANASGQVTLKIDRAGEQHEFGIQPSTYAQVFGSNRSRASDVPEPPQNRFVQRDEPRVAFRPNYEEAASDKERLERVQQRIGQLEQELVALRKDEQDLQNTLDNESNPAELQDSASDQELPADEVTPADDSPAPGDDSDAVDNDVSIKPPTNAERLSPSAR